jgi:hypothetical protein
MQLVTHVVSAVHQLCQQSTATVLNQLVTVEEAETSAPFRRANSGGRSRQFERIRNPSTLCENISREAAGNIACDCEMREQPG